MWIAKLIKPDTSLFLLVQEKIKVLDRLFSFKPISLFPIWVMIASGIAANEGMLKKEFLWDTHLSLGQIFFFIAITLLGIGNFIGKDDFTRFVHPIYKGSGNFNSEIQKRKLHLRMIIGLCILILSVGVHAQKIESINPILSMIPMLLFMFVWSERMTQFRQNFRAHLFGKIFMLALSGLLLFITGWLFGQGEFIAGFFHSIPYIAGFLSICLLTLVEIEPKVEKERFNRINLSKHGVIIFSSLGFITISVVIGFYLQDPVISTSAIISFPFFLIFTFQPRSDHWERALKYPFFIMTFFLGSRFPWFFLLLFVFFHFLRIYYYFKYKTIYPTFALTP